MSELLQVGDVFTAASLANATYRTKGEEIDRRRINVGESRTVILMRTEHREGGWSRTVTVTVDRDATDPSRATAEFLVIRTEMSGGGCGHSPGDYYPNGWGVTAVRLAPNGEYDPEGEVVFFRQSGCFTNMLNDAVRVRTVPIPEPLRPFVDRRES